MIDVPQRSCSAFTGASRDRNSGITGSTYSQVFPLMLPEALNMHFSLGQALSCALRSTAAVAGGGSGRRVLSTAAPNPHLSNICAVRGDWPSTASRPPGHPPGPEPPSDQPPSDRHTMRSGAARGPDTSRSSGSQPNNPIPVRMVTPAAHRDRPREATLGQRISPGTSARIRHSCSHS